MRPRSVVVGLAGPAGVGKSTLAARLAEAAAPLAVRRMAFADALRDMLRALGVPEASLVGDRAAKERPCAELLGQSARHAMRTLGTEWGRRLVHPDLWVDAWRRRLAETSEPVVIVDDVRFPNEIAAIRAAGGVVVKLVRPLPTTPLDAALAATADPHPSEAGLADGEVDMVLDLRTGGFDNRLGEDAMLALTSGGPECGRLLDALVVACHDRRAAMQRAGWDAYLAASGAPGRDLLRRLAGVVDLAPGADAGRDVDPAEVAELFAALGLPWGGMTRGRLRGVVVRLEPGTTRAVEDERRT